MAEKKIICGIDVGTTKIVAVIAEYSDKDFSIVGIGESKSDGLQRGVIVNIKDTIKSLGNYSAIVDFGDDISAKVKLKVIAE